MALQGLHFMALQGFHDMAIQGLHGYMVFVHTVEHSIILHIFIIYNFFKILNIFNIRKGVFDYILFNTDISKKYMCKQCLTMACGLFLIWFPYQH